MRGPSHSATRAVARFSPSHSLASHHLSPPRGGFISDFGMDRRSPPHGEDVESFSGSPVFAGYPSLPSRRIARNFWGQDQVVHSILGSYTFFCFLEDFPLEDGHGVSLDSSWRSITRRTTDAAFRLNPSGFSRDLFISWDVVVKGHTKNMSPKETQDIEKYHNKRQR